MSIQGIVANIKEANTISVNRSYSDVVYREEDPRMAIWRLEAEYTVRKATEEQDADKTTNK